MFHYQRFSVPEYTSLSNRVVLINSDYAANGGWETFLSYEDPEKDILVGLLRLRKCSEEGTYRKELLVEGGSSMVRELVSVSVSVPERDWLCGEGMRWRSTA